MFKRSIKKMLPILTAAAIAIPGTTVFAADYKIDPTHSFIEFKTLHLGYSWLYGRFNNISGTFSHDPAKPEANSITVEIDATSVDTNHAERDKHLRSGDFLEASAHPKAMFKSTGYSGTTEEGVLEGELTLYGITKPIAINIKKIGEGKDPWGGYRAGFEGTFDLTRKDFGIDYNLGPGAEVIKLELGIEGIRM